MAGFASILVHPARASVFVACCATSSALAGGSLPPWTSAEGVWAFTGGAPNHPSLTRRPFPSISAPRWTRPLDDSGNLISWIAQASPVVTPDLVIAVGFVSAPGQPANRPKVFAFNRNSGQTEWVRSLPSLSPGQFFQGSQSSLVLDTRNNRVIAVLGTYVTAMSLYDGDVRWQHQLTRNIINASPVITDDLGCENRLYITDYDAATVGGSLHCINVDPFDVACNPYEQGEVVWSILLNGTSGNTPAYLPRRHGGQGYLYVANAGTYGSSPGSVRAFPVGTYTAPTAAWTTSNCAANGFFGGVNVVPVGPSGRTEVYGVTYEFGGGLFSANIVRLDGATGAMLGTTATNRASTVPIVLPGGFVGVSAGLQSLFALSDTVPTLSMHDTSLFDAGSPTMGGLLWNSAMATWVDLNFDNIMDPGEYMSIGGYTHQPLVSLWKGHAHMAIGTFAPGDSTVLSSLFQIVDLQAGPLSPSFVFEQVDGAGGSPSLAGPNMYSVGTEGLCAFGLEPARFDIDLDDTINSGDLAKWERGQGQRDIDDDGSVTNSDRDALVTLLRAEEPSDMLEGRW